MPIKEMQVDTWMQKRHASAAHFNAANKRSLELTMLEALFFEHKLTKKTTDNQLGPEGGKVIAEALKINSSIQHLNLESNHFQISFFSFFPF